MTGGTMSEFRRFAISTVVSLTVGLGGLVATSMATAFSAQDRALLLSQISVTHDG